VQKKVHISTPWKVTGNSERGIKSSKAKKFKRNSTRLNWNLKRGSQLGISHTVLAKKNPSVERVRIIIIFIQQATDCTACSFHDF